MKKIIACCFVALAFAGLFARTVDECNAEIKSLNAERLELQKFTVVKYRKTDHPSLNVSKRLKVVEVNRNFVSVVPPYYHETVAQMVQRSRAREEWSHYVRQIPESDKRVARLDEIKMRIAEIEKEKKELIAGRPARTNNPE